jgi:plasmid stabilization system protein ParE
MKLRFTPRAIENLADIADYLNERNPAAARRVRAAIYDALATLLMFPDAGRPQTIEPVRKFVTSKYGYLIYYAADPASDEIVILNVKHPAQARDFQDD